MDLSKPLFILSFTRSVREENPKTHPREKVNKLELTTKHDFTLVAKTKENKQTNPLCRAPKEKLLFIYLW